MEKRIIAGLLAAALAQTAFAGLGSNKTLYVGGTWTQYKEGTEGKLDLSSESVAVFVPDAKKAPRVEIPFSSITSLEYGQKAGRRIGATIGWGATTLGIAALPMLLSKKRKHYLSVGYTVNGKDQGVVLEIGKDVTRGTLKTFETRSKKEIEYESEDARKNVGN